MACVSKLLLNWYLLFTLCSFAFQVQSQRYNQKINSPPLLTDKQKDDLMFYARITWKSMVSLTFPTGLPSDRMNDEDDDPVSYTSVTNIGAYMWSVIVARELKLISNTEAVKRVNTTLQTLANLETYDGHFIQWYNARSGKGSDTKFVSSVDSGWLAAALVIVKNAVPEVRRQADKLLNDMDFGAFLHKSGCLNSGFYPLQNKTTGQYFILNTETRIAAYIGIGRKQLPEELYLKMKRTPLPGCDDTWAEMQPGGYHKTYLGFHVFEGHYKYRNYRIVPSWGGSMFEALMVPLIVPETSWGPKSWGINHPLYVKAQMEHGMEEARYGYWGFSPAYNPSGRYKEYGVDDIGINPNGYYSNNNNTGVDYGFPDCGSDPKPSPPASAYANGVVTPHALFLGLTFEAQKTIDALKRLRENFSIFGKYGFYDAVNVQTGQIAKKQLSLDQGMILAAIGNVLADNCLQRYFAAEPKMERRLRRLISMLEFSSGISNTT